MYVIGQTVKAYDSNFQQIFEARIDDFGAMCVMLNGFAATSKNIVQIFDATGNITK